MITLQNLCLTFASRAIFDDMCATILPNDRVGLVGSNGAGKTTLLKTLAKEQEIDSGKIIYGSHIQIGYLPQDGIIAHRFSLFEEVESAAVEILHVRHKQAQLEEQLRDLPDSTPTNQQQALITEISELDDSLVQLGAHTLPAQVESILIGLGFKQADMTRQTSEFSGGWQMRIALAKLLLAQPHLLLLDEPTNHLDLPSQCWLERFLQNYEGAIMVVSHDQAFLDAICNKIYEVSRGQLTVYTGNYSTYEREKVARAHALASAYETQKRKIDKTQEFIDRFRAKATKAAQVQSRIKALNKIERIEIEDRESSIGFRFPPARNTGQQVLKIEGITYAYDEKPLFEALEATLEKGEKIGIVGPNGAGKSTLLKIIAGVLTPQAGKRTIGHNVELAYFAQHQAEALDPNKTVLNTVSEVLSGPQKSNPRAVLGSLLFTGDDAFKPVRVLSGGEKNRLALAKILLKGANCLLLDEPTNHLDMASKGVLRDAIAEFQGAAIIVSHDRAFLDPLVQKVWEIRDGKIRVFHGNVTSYIAWFDEQEVKAKALHMATSGKPTFENTLPHPAAHSKKQRMHQAALAARIKQIEDRIHILEAQRTTMEQELGDPEFFKKEAHKARQRVCEHEAIMAEIEKCWVEWAQIQEA